MVNLGNLPGQNDVPTGGLDNWGYVGMPSGRLPYAGYHAYTAAPWQQYQPNSRLGGDLVHAVPYNPGAGYANGLYNYQHLGNAGNAKTPAGVNPAALSYWQMVQAQQQQAAQAAANSANAGNGLSGGGSSGGGGSGGGGGGVALPNIAGLQAGINQQFDARVALLKQLLGQAHTGIGAVGNQVNQQLVGLAKDSSAEGKKIAADIAAQYAAQRQTAGTDQAALLADLQRNGANVGVLQATNAQQNQNLSGEQARQAALDARLQQVLGSSMTNRQAGAVAQTGGFQQQLDTKGALLQQQLDAQRAQAMQALQQQVALARAGGGGRGGSGGRRSGSGSGSGGLSFSNALAAYNFGNPSDAVVPRSVGDLNGMVRNIMGGDFSAPQTQGYATDLMNGANPAQLIANIRSRMVPGGKNSDLAGPIGNELLTLVNSYGRAQQDVNNQNKAIAANKNNRDAYLRTLLGG